MSATLTAPNGNRISASDPAVQAITKPPLWGDLEIPVIVGTGGFSSGKTTFGISICPGPETLVMDNEGSSLTFKSAGFEHIDMSNELRKAHGDGFTPADRYVWWKKKAIEKGKTGKYRVLVVDPATELEDGLAQYIRTHVSEFGMTADQMVKSSGIFWGVMKSEWKKTLDMLRTYFETVYLTVHLRTKYEGNTPTKELEPKGKETLYELASLFLWFERTGTDPCPSAGVSPENGGKSRLSKFAINSEGEFTPIAVLPPRLPRATPAAIRKYIATPPDYSKLKKGERVVEKVFTEAQKLELQERIASANALTEQASLSKLQIMQEQARLQAERADALARAPQAPDRSAQHAAAVEQKVVQRALEPITQHTLNQIIANLNELFPSDDEKKEFLTPRVQAAGVERVSMMTEPQAMGVLSELLQIKAERLQVNLEARGKEFMSTSQVGSGPGIGMVNPGIAQMPPENSNSTFGDTIHDKPNDNTNDAPFVANGQEPVVAVEQPGPRQEQIDEYLKLYDLAFDPAKAGAEGPALVLKHGATRVGLLTPSQCDRFLAELRGKAADRAAKLEANKQPPAPLATPEQIAKLGELATACGWPPDAQLKWLAERGVDAIKFRQNNPPPASPYSLCSAADVDQRIQEFQQIQQGFGGGMPGN